MRFILPILLIGAAIIGVIIFINPMYHDISGLKAQASSYDEALQNSRALENERDKLTKKYNSIDPSNLAKLSKMVPNNVDNIRLILEIEKVAGPYAMVLRDVKYNTTDETQVTSGETVTQDPSIDYAKDYGSWDLEFSTQGTYQNFVNFVKALETNLRVVDISSVEFASQPVLIPGQPVSSIFKYNFKIKTYWLKD